MELLPGIVLFVSGDVECLDVVAVVSIIERLLPKIENSFFGVASETNSRSLFEIEFLRSRSYF